MEIETIRKMLVGSDSLSSFLTSYLEWKKKECKGITISQFSKKLGYKNSSYINDIINKKRRGSLNFIFLFCKKERLAGLEKDYLCNLFEGSTIKNLEIIKIWKIPWVYQKELNQEDLIILTCCYFYIGESSNKNDLIKNLNENMKHFMNKKEIEESISRLLLSGQLIEGRNGILSATFNRKSNIPKRNYLKLFNILSDSLTRNYCKNSGTSNMPCFLTPEAFDETQSILFEAFEKIAIVANNDLVKPVSNKNLYCIFTSWSQLL